MSATRSAVGGLGGLSKTSIPPFRRFHRRLPHDDHLWRAWSIAYGSCWVCTYRVIQDMESRILDCMILVSSWPRKRGPCHPFRLRGYAARYELGNPVRQVDGAAWELECCYLPREDGNGQRRASSEKSTSLCGGPGFISGFGQFGSLVFSVDSVGFASSLLGLFLRG